MASIAAPRHPRGVGGPGGSDRDRLGQDLARYLRLEVASGHQVDPGPEQLFELRLGSPEGYQAHTRTYVDEEVHVALGPLLASGDTAEDPGVAEPVAGQHLLHLDMVTADSLTDRPADPLDRRTLTQTHVQLKPSGNNQTSQRRNRRLAGTGLVGAHHTLSHASPPAQLRLGQAGTAASLPQQTGRIRHTPQL